MVNLLLSPAVYFGEGHFPPSPLKSNVSRWTYLRDRHFGWRTQLGESWEASEAGMGRVGGHRRHTKQWVTPAQLLCVHVTTSWCPNSNSICPFVPLLHLLIHPCHHSMWHQDPRTSPHATCHNFHFTHTFIQVRMKISKSYIIIVIIAPRMCCKVFDNESYTAIHSAILVICVQSLIIRSTQPVSHHNNRVSTFSVLIFVRQNYLAECVHVGEVSSFQTGMASIKVL